MKIVVARAAFRAALGIESATCAAANVHSAREPTGEDRAESQDTNQD